MPQQNLMYLKSKILERRMEWAIPRFSMAAAISIPGKDPATRPFTSSDRITCSFLKTWKKKRSKNGFFLFTNLILFTKKGKQDPKHIPEFLCSSHQFCEEWTCSASDLNGYLLGFGLKQYPKPFIQKGKKYDNIKKQKNTHTRLNLEGFKRWNRTQIS